MKTLFIAGWVVCVSHMCLAQEPVDRKKMEDLCGCFAVSFRYAETFSPNEQYKFHNREIIDGGLELVLPIVSTDRKLVLQHLLIISEDMIVKHWREEWTYENAEFWKYQGDLRWTRDTLSPELVRGTWTQTVWEVSDAPRYQGFGKWMTTDGTTFWQNTADAPLPRREYTVRHDYNILKRTNRIHLNAQGWLHEQDNKKILRDNGRDSLIAEEKGINEYRRVDISQCEAGKKYWENYQTYWSRVRQAWDNYLATHQQLELRNMVDNKALHDYLFALGRDFADQKLTGSELDEKIKTVIGQFIKEEKKMVHP